MQVLPSKALSRTSRRRKWDFKKDPSLLFEVLIYLAFFPPLFYKTQKLALISVYVCFKISRRPNLTYIRRALLASAHLFFLILAADQTSIHRSVCNTNSVSSICWVSRNQGVLCSVLIRTFHWLAEQLIHKVDVKRIGLCSARLIYTRR